MNKRRTKEKKKMKIVTQPVYASSFALRVVIETAHDTTDMVRIINL